MAEERESIKNKGQKRSCASQACPAFSDISLKFNQQFLLTYHLLDDIMWPFLLAKKTKKYNILIWYIAPLKPKFWQEERRRFEQATRSEERKRSEQAARSPWKPEQKQPFFPSFGYLGTSLVAQTVKRLPTVWETRVQSLGREDLLEKEVATHSSTLAWKIPWMEEPGRLQSVGSQRVRHD